MQKSVVIVEDDPGLRRQLALVLNEAPDIECLYSVGSGEAALEQIPKRVPDVVLMDINLPGMSGIECVAHLKKQLPKIEIVMLTIYENSDNLFNALKAGASGYLIKSSSPDALYDAVRDVMMGGAPFSSHIARQVVRHFRGVGEAASLKERLTPRENEVIELLAAGYLYKEVADQLGIGQETVRSHVKKICEKLQVRSRVEAIAKYLTQ